ncbi:MAG: preprotein translocase subunit YajC [Candidatus Glassbacteria bacterium]|nr:preprotein translocase subunit YajC [Candidatus Glassbacteria bacterium]
MMGQSGAEGGQGGGSMFFLMIIATFGILYFLIMRPQQKEQQRLKQMLSNLSRGDDVVTAGGIYGKIIDLDEHTVDLKVAEGTKIKVERARISRVIARGEKGD